MIQKGVISYLYSRLFEASEVGERFEYILRVDSFHIITP